MTRSRVLFGVQVLVTVGLLALLFRRLDWFAFRRALSNVSLGFYLGSLLAVVAGHLLYALRWHLVLGAVEVQVPYRSVLELYLLGLFFSNLLPTAIGGDAAKIYYLGRRKGYVDVGASVFMDRFLGFFWLAAAGTALAWQIAQPRSPLFILSRNLLTIFCVAPVAALFGARLVPIDRLLRRKDLTDRSEVWLERLGRFIAHVAEVGRQPRIIGASLLVVTTYVILMALVYRTYFALNGAPGAPLMAVANVIVSVAVFSNVPVSVNGIGLREQLHYLLFAGLGLPGEVSVSLSLLMFSHILVLSLVGCVVWFRLREVP